MSISRDIGAYLGTRFQLMRFLPLAAFLVLAGSSQASPSQPLAWLSALLQAVFLVLLFRIWDDIADLDEDRRYRPGRILGTTRHLNAFLVLSGLLVAINGVLLLWREASYVKPAAFVVLCIGLLGWYRLRPTDSSPGLTNSFLLMLKYPAIAWLAGAPVPVPDRPLLLFCLASVYLILVAFEILDDDRLARLQSARISLVVTVVLLLGVWIFIAAWNTSNSGLTMVVFWIAIIVGTSLLGLEAWKRLKQGVASRIGYGFFVVGLLAQLAVTAEKNL